MTLSESTSGLLAGLSDELAGAVERAARSVVAVNGRRRFPGSGIVWTPTQVVTAAHVLERDTDLSIATPEGRQLPAKLVGGDRASDLAVLEIQDGGLTPIERGPAQLQAGHLVLA